LLVATILLAAKLHSHYVKEPESENLERLESVSKILERSDLDSRCQKFWKDQILDSQLSTRGSAWSIKRQ